MGFKDLNCAQCRFPPGYSEFMNLDLRDEHFFSDPSNAHKLLLTLKMAIA
jgi:hypothetical protein